MCLTESGIHSEVPRPEGERNVQNSSFPEFKGGLSFAQGGGTAPASPLSTSRKSRFGGGGGRCKKTSPRWWKVWQAKERRKGNLRHGGNFDNNTVLFSASGPLWIGKKGSGVLLGE